MRNILKMLAVVLALGVVTIGVATAQPRAELSESFSWPEAGLTLPYPDGWGFINDSNFDFVLVEPTQNVSFIGLQSGSFAPDIETLEDMMRYIADTDADSLVETTLGEAEAWRLDIDNEGGKTIVVGFSPGEKRVALLILYTDSAADWESVYEEVIAGATVEPLALDHELLNSQMQASLEADGSLTVGDPEAPIVIVEFMDFSCGHCATFNHSLDRLVQDYVMTGKARLTYSVLTFVGGPFSEVAGTAQYCAAEQGFGWDMHTLLFREYETKGAQTAYTADNIVAVVADSGLDVDVAAFETCLSNPKTEQFEANGAWADEMEVTGTPTAFYGTSTDELALLQSRALLSIYELLDAVEVSE